MVSYQMIGRLDELPPQARICLFGAGSFGASIKRFIQAYRPDLVIACFGDNYRSGIHETLPVLSLAQVAGHRGLDLVAVTSAFWEEILPLLARAGIGPLGVINPEIRQFFPTPEEIAQFAKARALFHREEDAFLYDLVVRARCSNGRDLAQYVADDGIAAADQYLDYLHFEKMRVVLEGGVLDGCTALSFFERMPPGARLIGFEPLLEVYRASPHRQQLTEYEIEVLPLALWDEPGTLCFLQEGEACQVSSSRVVEHAPDQANRRVQSVLLDEFVTERGLERVDFIKMDIEGAEPHALRGALTTLTRFRPQLAICIYHQKEHLYEIPLWLAAHLTGYRYFLGHYGNDIWETVFYGLPEEL